MNQGVLGVQIRSLGKRALVWFSILLSGSVMFHCSDSTVTVHIPSAPDDRVMQWLQEMDRHMGSLERAMWHESCSARFQICCGVCKLRVATQTDCHRLGEVKHVIEANPEYALTPHVSLVNRARSRTLIDACVAQDCPRLFKWLLTHSVHLLEQENSCSCCKTGVD